MALNFYSPNAYRYVRSVFENNIPAPVTMRAWYRSVDGSPGVTEESISILEQKTKQYKENGKELFISLLTDEVAIKKSVQYDKNQRKFTGFVSVENNKDAENNEPLSVAKNSLVLMAVGDNFKLPVAYFLLSKLQTYERAALTDHVICRINGTGATVISLTGDGLITNIAVTKLLGADYENDRPFFTSTSKTTQRIYCIWDPPHMLKLARGCFANHQLYHEGKPLQWKLIVDLHKMQQERNFNLGNKLTDLHLNFHLKPMNVRLAAQTMSNSIADCLCQLKEDNYPGYQNCDETEYFIRLINNVFDVSNTKPKVVDEAFKRAISTDTAQSFFTYFAHAKKYLKAIEIDEYNGKKSEWANSVPTRKLAIKSRNFTPFFGMIHNLTAFEHLYHELVSNGHVDALHTFRFSQDHLETWFSSVRRGLGMYIYVK